MDVRECVWGGGEATGCVRSGHPRSVNRSREGWMWECVGVRFNSPLVRANTLLHPNCTLTHHLISLFSINPRALPFPSTDTHSTDDCLLSLHTHI